MVSLSIRHSKYYTTYLKAKTVKEMEVYLQKIDVLPKNRKLNDYRRSFFGRKERKFECGESDRFLTDQGDIGFNGKLYDFNIDVDGRKLKEYELINTDKNL